MNKKRKNGSVKDFKEFKKEYDMIRVDFDKNQKTIRNLMKVIDLIIYENKHK